MRLHHEVLSSAGAPAQRSLVVLHGLLGSGGNLRTLARQFLDARPGWQAVLVDLRAHGESLEEDGFPDTLERATQDLAQTCATWTVPPRAVLGHSFGGKVALGLPALCPGLEDVVTLDSTPGTRVDARGSEATLAVVELLEALQGPWASRDDFVRAVQGAGQPRFLGQWLAMNLERRDGEFHFRLALPRIRALLTSYLHTDLWPALEAAAHSKQGPRFHLVIGTRSLVFALEERVHATHLESESNGRVTVDLLDTGHWVHTDDPKGTLRVLLSRVA
ncbi:MAG: alpha/beta hydrolase [Myxococcales bacterium]|nr:alpha/beta hydrolase [Myxococcales bacterium]